MRVAMLLADVLADAPCVAHESDAGCVQWRTCTKLAPETGRLSSVA
jgi:hypothetical protein